MLELYAHPLSSYSWKVLIALWENGMPFTYRSLGPDQPENGAALAARWPPGKFPLLVDGDVAMPESSLIIEYLRLHFPGPVRLLPADPGAALEVRLLDRVFDEHVMANMQRVVADAPRPPERRDPVEVEAAGAALDTIYAWLNDRLAGREWAAGDFSLADCAAAPSLFYADWVQPFGERFPTLSAYRARLLRRPSVARAVEEARPYRHLFPLGAPDRD